MIKNGSRFYILVFLLVIFVTARSYAWFSSTKNADQPRASVTTETATEKETEKARVEQPQRSGDTGRIKGQANSLEQRKPQPAPQALAHPRPQVQRPAVNAVTTAAVSAGVLVCTSRINQVTSYLTSNVPSGAFLFTSPQQPDQHVFSTSIELNISDRYPIYASASFQPNAFGGCDAVYDTVEYKDRSCDVIEQELLEKSQKVGTLKTTIDIFNAGAVKFFTMPAGQGCVVIQKEVVQ